MSTICAVPPFPAPVGLPSQTAISDTFGASALRANCTVKIQDKVHQLVRELQLIEEDSRDLKLDQVASISIYFGGDPAHLSMARSFQDKWLEARRKLMTSADKIMRVPPASVDFTAANGEWLTTLKSFRQTSDEINSVVTVQALENLKKSFASPTI